MSEEWTQLECEVIVDDYLDMLNAELRQERYSKTEHRRALRSKVLHRTDGSIEYKHQNISAVLIHSGHVYIPGYKPAWNYQSLLADVVNQRIAGQAKEIIAIEEKLISLEPSSSGFEHTVEILVDPPERQSARLVKERNERSPRHVDYAEREARNRRLGESGEAFIFDFERKRLKEIGREDLIADVEWTSKLQGDGTGYDIRSFRGTTDEPLFVEVKTTNAGKYQPFVISANEVKFSQQNGEHYALYRLFDFAKVPRLFSLEGSISNHVQLNPVVFTALF